MLEIDLNFIIVFVIIWALVIVLTRVFFKPYLDVREQRKKILEENQKAHELALKEYQDQLGQIEASLKEAKKKSQLIKEKVITEAVNEKARLISEIQAEIKEQVTTAREELGHQTDKLKAELREKVEVLAEQLEEKLIN